MTLVLYRRRALTRSLERNRGLGRAFDKAVRRKPLAGAADTGCYGNSIDFCLKALPDGDFGQNVIIDFHHVAVLAAIRVILPPAPSVFQEDSSEACVYTRGSVCRASGFVLTGYRAAIWRRSATCVSHL